MIGAVVSRCVAHAAPQVEFDMAAARISIVIPVLNEANHLARTLAAVEDATDCEIIVVDGGSGDGTEAMAATKATRVLRCTGGRARQMNLGAAAATGDILLFLHGDTRLPHRFDEHVRTLLKDSRVAAGAFRLCIDGPQRALRVIQWVANLRARYLRLPYGDQAPFLRAETFWRVGGFHELPIMEDFEFVRRVRHCGQIVILPDEAVTSARRWRALGPWRTTLLNQAIILGYHCGVSPDTLARWYSRPKGSRKA